MPTQSRGERQVAHECALRGIHLRSQVTFRALLGLGSRRLRFDFGTVNTAPAFLIEFDGRSTHGTEAMEAYGETNGLRRVAHDAMKDAFAAHRGIPLLRIGYRDDVGVAIDDFMHQNRVRVLRERSPWGRSRYTAALSGLAKRSQEGSVGDVAAPLVETETDAGHEGADGLGGGGSDGTHGRFGGPTGLWRGIPPSSHGNESSMPPFNVGTTTWFGLAAFLLVAAVLDAHVLDWGIVKWAKVILAVHPLVLLLIVHHRGGAAQHAVAT
jgi:hypothetical protein